MQKNIVRIKEAEKIVIQSGLQKKGHRQREPRIHWELLQDSPWMKTRPNGQKTSSE